MAKYFRWVVCVAVVLIFSSPSSGQPTDQPDPKAGPLPYRFSEYNHHKYSFMTPDQETLDRWIQKFAQMPRAEIVRGVPLRSSVNLLNHLEYDPVERHQGNCGNCWVWAGTGMAEVALSVQEGIRDRLSIQYLNSCSENSQHPCCGGDIDDFISFYTIHNCMIPWSNENAGFYDKEEFCETVSSPSCDSITVTPRREGAKTLTRRNRSADEADEGRLGKVESIISKARPFFVWPSCSSHLRV